MEPLIPLSLALSLLGGSLTGWITFDKMFRGVENRDIQRNNLLKNRVDTIELRLANDYRDKDYLTAIFNRLDDRMDRMDSKLDQILISYNRSAK